MVEVDHEPTRVVPVTVDFDDSAEGAVSEVAVGIAWREEVMRWRSAEDFVAGLEFVIANVDRWSVQLAAGLK